jgi:dTDP-4-dehydrorhamnose reductase
MRKTLLIGSTGFLGQTFKDLNDPRLVPLNRADLDLSGDFDAQLAQLLEIHQPDTAIITAANSKPDACKLDPVGSRTVNVDGTIRLLQGLRRASVKPVFFSTDHVFNGQKGGYSEDDPYSSITVYGKQKVETETYVREHFRHYLIVRTSKQVAMRVDLRNNLSEMALKLKTGQPIRCASDSSLSPSFVEDIAAVTLKLLEKPTSGVYHVSSPRAYTRLELGQMTAKALGASPELVQECSIEDFKFAEVRPPNCILDSSKLLKEIEFKLTPLEEGLTRLIEKLDRPG